MATLSRLCEDDGPLTDVRIPLKGREQQRRWFYASAEFMTWLREELPHLTQGRLRAADTPEEQMDQILHRWITGREMLYNRMFKDLMPGRDEVWEMKTADLRIFGWMSAKLKFVSVFADYADDYKGKNSNAKYDAARKHVISYRNTLKLDQPKIATGTFGALVHV